MFVSHCNTQARPVLEATISGNGPADIKVTITDNDYFYLTIDEAYTLVTSILTAQNNAIVAKAAKRTEEHAAQRKADGWAVSE